MTATSDVLVFSKRSTGGVRILAGMLREEGMRPVLVSADPDDMNRDSCDAHVVVDWDRAGLPELVAAVDAAGVVPAAVVNLVEPLIGWQIRTARHYGLPGGEPGREVLTSKALVRGEMRRLGLSALPFAAGPAGSFPVGSVTEFPVIVKPSLDSGASRLVRLAHGPGDLSRHLGDIAAKTTPELEVVVERYIEGTEFSIDGPVLDGRFRALFCVEKTQHDERRHHDAGLRISPPPSAHVRRGVEETVEDISALCTALDLAGGWLHVEGRVPPDGRSELVEINPRPGGGLHRTATLRTCGVDPVRAIVQAALGGEQAKGLADTARNTELLALLPFEVDRIGQVTGATPIEEIKAIPGVVDGYQFDRFEVLTLDQENFFTEALITAETVAGLGEVADRVRAAFRYEMAEETHDR
ncbi:acetyl-CoA carboxylase biotin carboxylase subunit family protein [Streptomyces sp. HK10]|uniref:ATP-grasp domain-containing protein n=1 Tax=Streptomyces sp. HK10 TaxID=3373255 RepID=UPI003749D989